MSSASPFVELAKNLMYLDPGSGSILLQLILGALLGLGLLLRTQWNKLKNLFKKPEKPEEENKHEQ